MFAFLNKKITQLLLLLLLFSFSVFIRFDDLSSDLNRESEWQTGHVLTTLSIWESNGMSSHYFSPVWTFNAEADRSTNSLGGIKDKNNFTYYVSYPPFSFILPYAIFRSFGADVSVNAIRIFSLVVHLLCSLLIFALVKMFWNRFFPALTAFCIYLFSTGNLWFHGNFYFADSLVQLFVLGLLIVFASISISPEKNKNTKLSLLALFTFFGVYTEWFALFVAGFIILFFIWNHRKNKFNKHFAIAIFFAVVFALCLTIIQYSSIAGFNELKQQSITKYNSRSGFIEQAALNGLSITKSNSFIEIYNNYIRHYNYSGLICLMGLAVLIWLRSKKTIQTKWNYTAIITLGVLALSVLTHHVLFFNFTAMHDVSTLKASLLFSLFIGYMTGAAEFQYKGSKRIITASQTIILIVFIALSAKRYHQINADANDTYYQERTGKQIAEFNSSDEMVFTNVGVSPIMMWYAQRNPMYAENEEECIKILERKHFPKGAFFKINPKDPLHFYEKIPLSISSR